MVNDHLHHHIQVRQGELHPLLNVIKPPGAFVMSQKVEAFPAVW